MGLTVPICNQGILQPLISFRDGKGCRKRYPAQRPAKSLPYVSVELVVSLSCFNSSWLSKRLHSEAKACFLVRLFCTEHVLTVGPSIEAVRSHYYPLTAIDEESKAQLCHLAEVTQL